MPDEDKTFSGSFVLDLRIWWRQVHTLYYKRVLQNEHVHLYQNSSTLQISHGVHRNLGETPSKKHKIMRSSFEQISMGKYITLLISSYNQ